ncbi:unnamed protein product [Pieris macdunnoughi]|uniref:Uncharacterized protein n=1 Tax=Pieris macdunnoughi TaxID=345717 RepID=A0A821P475_9NEOP|nr:unnamed protein product [Pieris macdunnoughi]
MVYESDFYTTRRPYRSNYSVTRAGDWEKVPFVPRPSLVPDPVTAFGRKARPGARVSVLDPTVRQNILPKPESKLAPLAPYVSPRDQTRARVLSAVGQRERAYEADPLGTPRDHMDVLLAQAHGHPQHTPHRHTPRHYVVVDREPLSTGRRAEEQYSYSYSTTAERSTGSGLPQRSSYSSTVERRGGSGPGGYSYTSERSSSLGGPSGYSYSSTTSGRLPYGTNYRHYSYRV